MRNSPYYLHSTPIPLQLQIYVEPDPHRQDERRLEHK